MAPFSPYSTPLLPRLFPLLGSGAHLGKGVAQGGVLFFRKVALKRKMLSLIHISEPTRH